MFGEDARTVAVVRRGQSVTAGMLSQQRQVRLGRLAPEEPRREHLPGGVIDEGDQAAFGCTTLEPVVVAAVNLHQLAATPPPRPGTVQPHSPPLLGFPQLLLAHPAAQCLHAVGKAMVSLQVLARQGRAEIAVVLAHQPHVTLAHLWHYAPVARRSPPLRNQPGASFLAQPPRQPLHLPLAHPQRRSRLPDLHPTRNHLAQHRQALRLPLAHQLLLAHRDSPST